MSTNIGTIEGAIKLNDQFSSVLSRVGSNISGVMAKTGKELDLSVGGIVGKLSGIAAGYLTVQASMAFLKSSVAESREWSLATAQVEQKIKSTGGAAGVAMGQLAAMAQQIQATTRVTDDQALSAEALGLTFKRIGADDFPTFIRLAADLAQTMAGAGGVPDMEGAVKLLGKSLNDAEGDMTQIARATGGFSDALKAQIKDLAESGERAAANALIFKELETTVGGAGAAGQDSMNQLSDAVDDAQQAVGDGLRPAIDDLAKALSAVSGSDVIPFLHHVGEVVGLLLIPLQNLVMVLQVLGKIDKSVGKFMDLGFSGGLHGAAADAAMVKANEAAFAAAAAHLKAGAESLGKQVMSADQLAFWEAATARDAKIAAEASDRQKKASEAIANALKDAFAKSADDAAAFNAALAALASGKSVEYAEALAAAMQQFPSASSKTIGALVALALEAKHAGDKFAQLKTFIEEAGKGVDLSSLRDVMDELHKGFVGSELDVAKTFRDASADYAKQFQSYNDAVDESLQNLADSYASLSVTSLDFFERQKAEIKGLVAEGLLSYKEGEVALYRVTQDFWDKQLDAWTSAMDYLAGVFGGVFEVLADLGKGIQQAVQFGKQIQELATNIARASGSSSSSAASAGAAAGGIATVVAIFATVYDMVDKWIKKMKSLRYGNAAEFTLVGGQEGTTRLDQQSFAIVNSIREAVRNFEQALRVSITDLDRIGIQIRNDGKYVAAWVNGVMLGHFENINDAIRAALTQAITHGGAQIAGLTDLMRQGLEGFTAPDADEFMRFMEQLREIGDLGLGEGVAAMESFVQHMNELFNVLMNMSMTPAVMGGMESIINSVASSLDNLYNTLTGHKEDAAEAAERQRNAYNAQRAIVMAQLQLMYMEIQARIADIQSRLALLQVMRDAGVTTVPHGGAGGTVPGGPGGGGENFGPGWTFNPSKGGGVLVIDSRNPDNDPQMAALLQILDALARAMGNLPPEIAAGGVHLRGGGGRGGGRREERADLRREVEGFGLGDVAAALRDAGTWFDDLTKRIHDAGYGAAETARLMGLAAEELARRQEEVRRGVDDRIAEFSGRSELAALGKTFDDLVRDIGEAGFSAEDAAKRIEGLTAEYERQAAAVVQAGRDAAMQPHQAALDSAAGIGSFERQLLDSQKGLDASREALRKLAKEAADAGRSTDWLAGDLARLDAAQAAVARDIGFEFLGSLKQLGVSLPTGVVLELAHAQWELAKVQAISAAMALAAAGAFEGLSFTLEELLGWINDADFNASQFGSGIAGPAVRTFVANVEQASNALSDLARRLVDAQKGIADLLAEMAGGQHGGVSARAALEFQQRRYDQALALARTGDIGAMESIDGIARDLLSAMAGFSPQLLAAQLPNMEDQLAGLLGITTAHEGNVLTSTLFQAGQQQVVDATNEGFGATVAVGTEQVNQQAQMNASLTTIANAQSTLNDRLALMEAELLVVKRIA